MQNSPVSDKRAKRKLWGILLILAPPLTVVLNLLAFSVANTLLGTANIQTLTFFNFALGLIGLVAIIGVLIGIPIGIYLLATLNKYPESHNAGSPSQVFTFYPLEKLFRPLFIANVIQIIGMVATIIIVILALNGRPVLDASINSLFFGLMLVDITAVILFLFWIGRAYRNLNTLGDKTDTTPGWAVGGFLIPIYSIYASYKTMDEIYTRSIGRKNVLLILGWWLSFGISSILSNISAQTFTSSNLSGNLAIASTILELVAIISGLLILKNVTNTQSERARRSLNTPV